MKYTMNPAFGTDDLEELGTEDVEEAWRVLTRDMRDDLPWDYNELVYVSHETLPNGDIVVTFTTPDTDLDWFEEAYAGYGIKRSFG